MTRAEFEQFLASPPHEKNVTRWPQADSRTHQWLAWPGHYKDYAVQLAWEVLQEAQRRGKTRALLVQAQPVVCSVLCPSVKKAGEEWTHSPLCQSLTAALAQEEQEPQP
jgi:hypothetical protein